MNDIVLEANQPILVPAPVPAATRKRWIIAYGLYNGITFASFTNAVWVTYLYLHGYSPLAIGLLETLFHVAKFVAEVPTGVFADLVGRRASLVVANILNALSLALFLVPTVPVMIVSFALSGVAYAFVGGAGDALLWHLAGTDDQTATEQANAFSKLFSRMFIVGTLGELVGAGVGGVMGQALIALPFLAQLVAYGVGTFFLLRVPEYRPATHERPHPLRHILIGLRAAWGDPVLLGLLLIGALTDGCWQTIYYYSQLGFHAIGFQLAAIGGLIAASMGVGIVFTWLAPRFMRIMAPRWLVIAFVGAQALGISLLTLHQPLLNLLGYLIPLQASVAVLKPATTTYINQRSPEAQRATVFSFQTGLFSLSMIVLFPLFGLGVTHAAYSAVYGWTLVALIAASLAIAGLVWGRLRRA